MRVLYLIYHAGNGGSEKYVYDMCEELRRRDCTVFLGYNTWGKLVEDLSDSGVECFQIEMPSWYHLPAVHKLKKLIKEYQIDIVHAQFSRENYLACFAKLFGADVEVIYTSHTVNEDGFVKRLLNGFVGKLNKAVIAVSKAVVKDLKKSGFPEEKVKLVYNGVNQVFDKTGSVDGISSDDVLLVNVSRFSQEKGLDYLLEQFYKALQSKRDLKLVLIGDGEKKEEICKQIESLNLKDRVVLTGYLPDPASWISRCDIYVSSSRRESLGYSILEAMSCGLPVIATDVGGCGELVNEESGCGYLVDFGSDEFSERIVQLSQDKHLREKFGSAAGVFVRKNFTKEKMMEESFRIYKESMDKKKKK